MTDWPLLPIDRTLFAVLWIGMVGFGIVHNVALYRSTGQPAVSVFQIGWFGGLALVVAASLFLGVRADSAG